MTGSMIRRAIRRSMTTIFQAELIAINARSFGGAALRP